MNSGNQLNSGNRLQNLQGNRACVLGAVAAGCRFYAGYPITPSSEIAENMSLEMPRNGGVFVQMEDEISSMAAIIGASAGGVKVMTATSGPGFSLKQENIGFAAATEIPCVIVNVMRGGPSTGMPTRPAQSDIMQARWGTHGDHPVVVLCPWSVEEIYMQAIRAFNIAESLRVPVVLLYDEVIGHLVETVDFSALQNPQLYERKWAQGDPETFLPYANPGDGVPEMARPGTAFRTHTTGLTHAEGGFPTQDPATVERVMKRLLGKVDAHPELVEQVDEYYCDDCELLIVSFGITARSSQAALRQLQEQGIKVGLFRPVTLWPFPQQRFLAAAAGTRAVLVAEMNAGQLIQEVQRHVGRDIRVQGLQRFDGDVISPQQIVDCAKRILQDD
ncbi:MAG TPA: 2-oxoacid:acceptor oxidoreductase subunit alpha [Gammaproteobacteria bacterium]|nr:2-oxoacid:acceptor oxidoreductase subunit alpha [Gammaproteobacteria bacterium]